MTVAFMRNKWVEVVRQSETSVGVRGVIVDTALAFSIELVVKLPDLEILAAEAKIERAPGMVCRQAESLMQKARGIRIGPGLRKIAVGIMGGTSGCRTLVNLFMECCNAVILSFTVPQIEKLLEGTEEERVEGFRDMLRMNPRLHRSCVAFAEESPIVKGL